MATYTYIPLPLTESQRAEELQRHLSDLRYLVGYMSDHYFGLIEDFGIDETDPMVETEGFEKVFRRAVLHIQDMEKIIKP